MLRCSEAERLRLSLFAVQELKGSGVCGVQEFKHLTSFDVQMLQYGIQSLIYSVQNNLFVSALNLSLVPSYPRTFVPSPRLPLSER